MFVVEDGDLVEVDDHERHEGRPPDAPPRPPRARPEPGRRAGLGQPVVVGHAERATRARRYVVAFRADNPGIWMDHCHNLPHAAEGLTMHVAYAGVTTPFLIGAEHHNEPE